MIDSIIKGFSKLFGNKSEKDIKEILPRIAKINAHYASYTNLSNDELRAKTAEFKSRIADYLSDIESEISSLKKRVDTELDMDMHVKEEIYDSLDKLKKERNEKLEVVLDEILEEAFAVVKETARRFKDNEELVVNANDFDRDLAASKDFVTIKGNDAVWKNEWDAAGNLVKWDMLHYDVQLIGGIVLHQGKISEMATGEGKTLVSTLPAYLNALSGHGVHLVTVNDYLARRDCEWNGPLFQFHGISTACLDYTQPNSEERREAYRADIVYGTNNEFGFDYLRDNMARDTEDLVQREHHYAMIDEVDSVLIDDARKPLIISGPVPRGDQQECAELKTHIQRLVDAQKKYLNTALTDAKRMIEAGDEKNGGMQLFRAYRGLPKMKPLIKFLGEPGMKAIMQKTENVHLADNQKEMPKVDAELFFVIDEKNNSIELTEKGIELITGSGEDQSFFVLPDFGGEMAEIEKSQLDEASKAKRKEELIQDFSEKSERIHSINQLLKAYCLFENDIDYIIVDGKIKIVDEQTGRVLDGRRYSDGLHQAIEAKENVKVEAATQTFATVTLQNYFRMYHKLSGMKGTAKTEAGELWEIYKLDVVEIPTNSPIKRDDKEDLGYKTTREKYNAVIEDIVTLVAQKRPVLVGTTSVEISELLGRMLKMRGIDHNILNAKLHKKEADIVAEAGKPGQVTIATNMAGRGTDIKLTEEVKKAGGLAIVGTERHDSRRVDRQLRGRAGRQGDPGSSQFYVSLEDNLMRLFGSERIAKMMDRMGLQEGEVIQHSMISKSIERAQKKVEENQFGVRKRLLEYDDVMNAQREVVYKRRYNALFGERLGVDLANMIFDTSEIIVETNKDANDFKNFEFELIRYFSMSSPVTEEEFAKMDAKSLASKVYTTAFKHYKDKMNRNADLAFPVIQNVYETQRDKFKRIVVPFTDGVKTLQVITDLEKAYESGGKQLVTDFEKNISLAIIDDAWKTHLRKMDELKQSVQLAVH